MVLGVLSSLLKMNLAKKLSGNNDVTEIFSPPRICARARERGIRGGWSLDWMTADPITGQKWDLRKQHVQNKVMMMLHRDKPGLVVACPPCTLFSTLQNMNGAASEEAWNEAVEMVSFGESL